jgi:hypothetical protein
MTNTNCLYSFGLADSIGHILLNREKQPDKTKFKPMSQSNRFILACLTSASLIGPGKIGPLSFCQFFFKIFQNEGSIKNLPITAIILNLEPKIIFAKPVKNGATQGNGQGWGKRIQLGILNLNQIGCRTGETLLSGWERVFSSWETLLSDWERVLSGGETLSSGGETPLSVWKRVLSGWETLLRGWERVLSGWKRVLSGWETLSSGGERVLSEEERDLSGEETLLSGEETLRGSENTLERSNALCRQGNKGKIIIYIKYKRRQT